MEIPSAFLARCGIVIFSEDNIGNAGSDLLLAFIKDMLVDVHGSPHAKW